MDKTKIRMIIIMLLFDLLIIALLIPLMQDYWNQAEDEYWQKWRGGKPPIYPKTGSTTNTTTNDTTYNTTNDTPTETPEISPTPDDSPIGRDEPSIYNRTAPAA